MDTTTVSWVGRYIVELGILTVLATLAVAWMFTQGRRQNQREDKLLERLFFGINGAEKEARETSRGEIGLVSIADRLDALEAHLDGLASIIDRLDALEALLATWAESSAVVEKSLRDGLESLALRVAVVEELHAEVSRLRALIEEQRERIGEGRA